MKDENFLKQVGEFLICGDEHFSIGLPFRDDAIVVISMLIGRVVSC